jgi:hypothetical protein
VGLGQGDEDFLTQAMADGRKDVRATAADLLARLPGSALIKRMTERADTWIRYRKSLLGGKLEVTPPAECDAAMVADGIEAKAPKNIGERAHWLRQVLSHVPPSHWTGEVLELGAKSEWADPLVLGWIDAATRFRDAEWCELLIEHHVRRSDRDTILPRLQELVRATPRPALEAVLARNLQRVPQTSFTLAAMANQRFSLDGSRTLLRGVQGVMAQRDQRLQQYCVHVFARQLSSNLDADLLSEVVVFDKQIEQSAPWASQQLQLLATNLEYRAEMAKEIRS